MKYKQKTNIEVRVRDISTSFMLYVSFDDKGTGHHKHSMYLHSKSSLDIASYRNFKLEIENKNFAKNLYGIKRYT